MLIEASRAAAIGHARVPVKASFTAARPGPRQGAGVVAVMRHSAKMLRVREKHCAYVYLRDLCWPRVALLQGLAA